MNKGKHAIIVIALSVGSAGAAFADFSQPGDLNSGGTPWGKYELTAASPSSAMARISAHHAHKWDSNPASPKVTFEISEFANDWDIEEMGLEIKADYVPGYYVGVKVCAKTSGNIGGTDGAVDTLTFSGASTYPETQLATFDPTGLGTCKTVNVYTPLEAGADEYTIMVRPQLQFVQAYWEYTIYGKVVVQYYPILH